MTERVKSLVDFHATSNFGSRANLLLQQKQARSAYLAITDSEKEDLAQEALSQIEKGNSRFDVVLCCLSCFHPGSLVPFHRMLLERRVIYPGVIFHGASSEIARQIVSLCDQDDYREHALVALAWIGDEVVQAAFSKWQENPPAWIGKLFVPPYRYAQEAGWELTAEGKRHDLFHPVASPLIPLGGNSGVKNSVRIGMSAQEICRWCKRKLVGLFQFAAIEDIFPNQGIGPVRIVTCQACTCYGPLFMKNGPIGEATWHEQNKKPSYLPPDSVEWPAFPESPLVMTKETRHFLETAIWSMLPGVAFSQVGGLPTWIQHAEFPTCPDCSQKMPFIGQVSNEDFMEYGEGIYYAFRCRQCPVTATCYQQT